MKFQKSSMRKCSPSCSHKSPSKQSKEMSAASGSIASSSSNSSSSSSSSRSSGSSRCTWPSCGCHRAPSSCRQVPARCLAGGWAQLHRCNAGETHPLSRVWRSVHHPCLHRDVGPLGLEAEPLLTSLVAAAARRDYRRGVAPAGRSARWLAQLDATLQRAVASSIFSSRCGLR